MRKILLFILSVTLFISCKHSEEIECDVCVYGGTSAGVIAAYSAIKEGKSVLLIEPGYRLGGLSSGGLGQTDIGNKQAVKGLSLDFYRRVGAHYNMLENWVFEPKVAEQVYKDYVAEANIPILYGHRILSAQKDGTDITSIRVESIEEGVKDKSIKAKVYIDCSYEGDLMARAGVSYTVGREDSTVYNESWNGAHESYWHQFPDGVDPYVEKGNPESGLLWGISTDTMPAPGKGDKRVQAYNYRICVTFDNYDPAKYELLIRTIEAQPNVGINEYFIISRMPNNKTDINNRGAFSTDMIGMNHNYPEASYEEREKIIQAHKDYTMGLLWFWTHDERIPEHLQKEITCMGLPKDEYVEYDHWTPQLYIREARRMIGEYVATQADCELKVSPEDYVGWAAYGMDSHNCQRIVVERNGMKMVKNEGDVEIGVKAPYNISYRSLTPKREECTNLLVPVCLSASHIAFGSIRMEPVFMLLGQSAAKAASLAIDKNTIVQDIDVKEIQRMYVEDPLLDGSTPDIFVDDPSLTLDEKSKWERVKSNRGYGPSFIKLEKTATKEKLQFPIQVKKDGKYTLYTYFIRNNQASRFTEITINDGDKDTKFVLDKNEIVVKGQTSGEWVPIGEYDLKVGKPAFVEFTNNGKVDGLILADAVLAVAKK